MYKHLVLPLLVDNSISLSTSNPPHHTDTLFPYPPISPYLYLRETKSWSWRRWKSRARWSGGIVVSKESIGSGWGAYYNDPASLTATEKEGPNPWQKITTDKFSGLLEKIWYYGGKFLNKLAPVFSQGFFSEHTIRERKEGEGSGQAISGERTVSCWLWTRADHILRHPDLNSWGANHVTLTTRPYMYRYIHTYMHSYICTQIPCHMRTDCTVCGIQVSMRRRVFLQYVRIYTCMCCIYIYIYLYT